MKRAKILLPITLDHWRSPIAALLRTCAAYNPQHDFYSFSNPAHDEDRVEGLTYWSQPHLHKTGTLTAPLRRYDLCQVASLTPKNMLAARLAKLRSGGKTKLLITINLEMEVGHPAYWDTFLLSLKHANHYLAVSNAVANLIKPYVGDRFLGVIPNGFDPTQCDVSKVSADALPEEVRTQPGKPFVLFVSSIEPRKHPEVIAQLAKANPDLWFICVGYVFCDFGRKCVEEFVSLPNVTWLGPVDRRTVASLMAEAKAMAFPSDREGLPLSVIEAMGLGLPVVAQPKSSLPELIRDGENGRLIDIADLAAWGDALRAYVQESPAVKTERARWMRAETVAKYAWSSIGAQYGKIYEQILG
jgi:glycosyltransferase involved in cell wall biosynthesis